MGSGTGACRPIYVAGFCIELDERGIRHERQYRVPAQYKGRSLWSYYVDLLVEDRVVVELKSVSAVTPVFEAHS